MVHDLVATGSTIWDAINHLMVLHKLEPETIRVLISGGLKRELESELMRTRLLKSSVAPLANCEIVSKGAKPTCPLSSLNIATAI